ncbi:multidrug efflux pump subunit AcrB [Pacificibacter maritimus]|uniref:Multidrug efflux pump subunit AcrB n=1 Tax=Pacificibacter maritimus TaxID=762213 RepID=A0A3N4U705_9RHOB|nr:efflux RND transporter permease subunit [Pacificibacter maritimus]RPE66533.1 multidrug efflux pump subunit AcrB [Pacificibacter maritimus]
MNIARTSIDRPIYTWIIMLICLLGGIWGFNSLGRLEDPAFTIKTAIVVTQYPGASAEEVALEVSEPIESEIQKMGEVDDIQTMNQPGLSWITVNMRDQYGGTELPAIWTKLRNRVGGAALPSGTSTPFVNDSFGDVYGMYFAVTAPGFSNAEINNLSAYLRRELLSVEGVSDVALSGVPNEVIFVEPDLALSTSLGISSSVIQGAISGANEMVDAGQIQTSEGRTIVQRPHGSDSEAEIASLSVGIGGKVVTLDDFSNVYRTQETNPDLIVRHNGVAAFTLGVAGISSENIVEVGKRVDAHLEKLRVDIPLGVSIEPIYQQHTVVEDASNAFLINLAMSVAIVVVVLAIFMGWQAAVVVGSTLLLTVVGTLLFMALGGIEMERISLGALIIAMGMLVDNAIVVAEGMQIAMRNGKSSRDAATEASQKTQIPLLGATIIGIMAFAGIGLSPDSTGEFLFSLFAVIGMSLLLSWGLAITVTPLLGHYFFKQGEADQTDTGYNGALFQVYAKVLRLCLRLRWLVVAALVVTTVVCYALFGQIKQQFFPDSNTPLYFVHYKLPQGASIHQTSGDIAVLEEWLEKREDVTTATSFIGMGASRFMLTYNSEDPNPSYGHMIVRVSSLDVIEAEMDALEAYAAEAIPQGEFRAKRLAFGPGSGAPIEVRFYGKDADILRDLADEAIERMTNASENILTPRQDWRERELVLRPIYADDRAQDAGISRSDIARTLEFAVEGLPTGTFREADRQVPIVLRAPQDDIALTDYVIYSESGKGFVPMMQVIDGFTFEAQDTLIFRRDRADVITVGVDIPRDLTAAEVQAEIQEVIEAMTIPDGYSMEWGGELESSSDAQASLGKQLPFSIIIMVLISVLLFNALRQPIIIWLLVPMSVNGVSLGLLATGIPFTFTALLGLLSLSGMLIKNGIVLVEEIDLTREASPEMSLTDAIVSACTSRLRPVFLAAATTILGMLPLISDAFFKSMAVTIMGGLAFASVLTLIAAPVLYYLLFAKSDAKEKAAAA